MMQFTADLKIGVPYIDSQHREMIDFANKAAALSASNPTKEAMEECLSFLGNYVVKHFDDEEKLQVESSYPRYQKHRDIHQEFIRLFNSLYEEFQKNGPSQELSNALSKSVSSWILTHIKMEDVTFGKHYTKFKQDRYQNAYV